MFSRSNSATKIVNFFGKYSLSSLKGTQEVTVISGPMGRRGPLYAILS